MALESYDALKEGGVESPVYELPLFAAFENHQHSESLRHELEMQTKFGNPVSFVEMGGAELRSVQPILSDTVDFGLRIDGQKFVHPGEFTDSLALSVQARGGRIAKESVTGVKILADSRPQVQSDLGIHSFDDVVIATGAWISRLGRAAGMRRSVGSGRGYSFSVASDIPLTEPIYLPRVRVAASIDPTSDHRFRLAGTMEFHPVDHPLIEERISAIVRSCAPYLRDVDWTSIEDQWVGSRPLTTDGLPVIGATEVDHVFLSGGHGMWGMTLGPASGRLLAELIATTSLPQALLPFDPLR
jgi:D-amino-acid dehydrogenase